MAGNPDITGSQFGLGSQAGLGSRSGLVPCPDLPGLRLGAGALHEIACDAERSYWSGLGFMLGLAVLWARKRRGPVIWLRAARLAQEYGVPHARGLQALGLDPGWVVLICPDTDKDLLWGLETAVQEGRVAAVLGEVPPAMGQKALRGGQGYGLTASRRVHLAADQSGVPLLVYRGACRDQPSAARSRWRVSPVRGEDLCWAPRWRVRLETCRETSHGALRRGNWEMEWDHEAHRFRLAAPLAHRPSGPSCVPPGPAGLGRRAADGPGSSPEDGPEDGQADRRTGTDAA
ncbi:MAG: ImuA family protein [Alphaproteobacteria bacterium]